MREQGGLLNNNGQEVKEEEKTPEVSERTEDDTTTLSSKSGHPIPKSSDDPRTRFQESLLTGGVVSSEVEDLAASRMPHLDYATEDRSVPKTVDSTVFYHDDGAATASAAAMAVVPLPPSEAEPVVVAATTGVSTLKNSVGAIKFNNSPANSEQHDASLVGNNAKDKDKADAKEPDDELEVYENGPIFEGTQSDDKNDTKVPIIELERSHEKNEGKDDESQEEDEIIVDKPIPATTQVGTTTHAMDTPRGGANDGELAFTSNPPDGTAAQATGCCDKYCRIL